MIHDKIILGIKAAARVVDPGGFIRRAVSELLQVNRVAVGERDWGGFLQEHVESYQMKDHRLLDPAQERQIANRVIELSHADALADEMADEIEWYASQEPGVEMPEHYFDEGLGGADSGRVISMAELQPHVQSMLPAIPVTMGALAMILRTVGSSVPGMGSVVRKVLTGRLAQAVGGWELFDWLTPGVDLPSAGDIPPALWDLFGGMEGGREGNFGLMSVEGVNWAFKEHGPVVREWVANFTPFVMFMDGYQAAQKKNGAWTFWKAKKPLVYVPGGPMSRKTARRLASLYTRERNRAKKDFGLVNKRTGSGS